MKIWLVQRNHTHFTSKIGLSKKYNIPVLFCDYILIPYRLNYAHGAEINRLVAVIIVIVVVVLPWLAIGSFDKHNRSM